MSHLKGPVQDILVAYFQQIPEREAAAHFCKLLLPVSTPAHDSDEAVVTGVSTRFDGTLVVHEFEPCAYAPGPTGGVEMRRSGLAATRDLHREAELAVALLEHVQSDALPADVFAVLVEMYVNQDEAEAAVEAAGGDLTGEETLRAALLVHVLVLMCEEHGADIVRDTAKGVHVIQLMLRSTSDETIGLSLQLLLAMLQGIGQLCQDDAKLLQGVLPTLEPLKSHSTPEIATVATDISVAIATRSLRWITDNNAPQGATVSDGASDPMDEIKRDLQDPLLPVRAHALGALRKLVLKRTPGANLVVVSA
jgi:hypothetical protein